MTQTYDPWRSVILQLVVTYFSRYSLKYPVDEKQLWELAFETGQAGAMFRLSKHRWPEILEEAQAARARHLAQLAAQRLLS